jgi:hypothetical protein
MTRRLAVFVALAAVSLTAVAGGARDAEIAAAIKPRVDAKKSTGMVVATIEPDGSTSMAAYGSPGPGALPLDADLEHSGITLTHADGVRQGSQDRRDRPDEFRAQQR